MSSPKDHKKVIDRSMDKSAERSLFFFQTPYKNNHHVQNKKHLQTSGSSKCSNSGCKCKDLLKSIIYSPSSNFLFHSPSSLEKYIDSFSQERINVLKLVRPKSESETKPIDVHDKENNPQNEDNYLLLEQKQETSYTNNAIKNLMSEFESSKSLIETMEPELKLNSISSPCLSEKKLNDKDNIFNSLGKKVLFESEECTNAIFDSLSKSNKSDYMTCSLSQTLFSTHKKKRFRKSSDQISLLNQMYKENSNKDWTKEMISDIAYQIGLPESKVYKWLWDKKNKELSEKKRFLVYNENKNKHSLNSHSQGHI